MAEMTRSARVSVLTPEFDDFLFAPIGEDKNGMLLRVVSALARLDVDRHGSGGKNGTNRRGKQSAVNV
jgi:hypothetical protein